MCPVVYAHQAASTPADDTLWFVRVEHFFRIFFVNSHFPQAAMCNERTVRHPKKNDQKKGSKTKYL